jgi:hypothetical protein
MHYWGLMLCICEYTSCNDRDGGKCSVAENIPSSFIGGVHDRIHRPRPLLPTELDLGSHVAYAKAGPAHLASFLWPEKFV